MPQNEVLCTDCEALDWRNIARTSIVPSGMVGEMRTPHRHRKNSVCRICRIFWTIMKEQLVQEWDPGRFRYRPLKVGPFRSQIPLSPSTDDLPKPVLLWLGGWEYFEDMGYGRESKYIALFQPGFWTESYRIQPLITDFSWMQNAIADCHKHHSNCSKTAPATFVPGLRVIDCLAVCSTPSVILAPDLCQYVALSYVWGPAHVAEDEVAAAIKDAIEVTLKLSLRYLWVDRYVSAQPKTLN